jgi:hypothetical protein
MQIAVPREEPASSSIGGTDTSWSWKTLLTFPNSTIDLDPATTSGVDKKTQPGRLCHTSIASSSQFQAHPCTCGTGVEKKYYYPAFVTGLSASIPTYTLLSFIKNEARLTNPNWSLQNQKI